MPGKINTFYSLGVILLNTSYEYEIMNTSNEIKYSMLFKLCCINSFIFLNIKKIFNLVLFGKGCFLLVLFFFFDLGTNRDDSVYILWPNFGVIWKEGLGVSESSGFRKMCKLYLFKV